MSKLRSISGAEPAVTDDRFRDRHEAGRVLAELLSSYSGQQDAIVLALPRGGLPVGLEVARALRVALDIFVVRKLGVPGQEELAMGAIASGGVRVVNDRVAADSGVNEQDLARAAAQEEKELERREHAYRGDRPHLDIGGRVVILIDDGLATGATMRAAISGVRAHGPARVVAAAPVASPDVCAEIGKEVDEIVCARQPEALLGVGAWYDEFPQLSDEDVKALLSESVR